ncbi:MAG: FAD-dependent oxidoreductase [Candidatus Thermoplasmatota archaeon]|nr:FAD-dependent oxidoreductase [Candidatus Thermoplasmatota archaeon]
MEHVKKIVVIGGSAAGPKAAARARRLDENAEVIIIQKDPDLSMASCGYPYYVGGVFDNRNQLLCTPTGVVRDPTFYMNAKKIKALTRTEAIGIDRASKKVSCRDLGDGREFDVEYDKLIIATGSKPRMPPIPGIELDGITTLQSMKDADYLRKVRDEGNVKKAVVVGGGLIGMETCEALHLAGIEITVIEMLPQVLTFLDWQLAKVLEGHVKDYAAIVITDSSVSEFLGNDGKLTGVKLSNGTELPCELAVVATGVVPNSELAKKAGLLLGDRRGILIDEYMQTSDPDIYAIGDCVEAVQKQTGKRIHAPWGDLANLQGRVAGENAVLGNSVKHPGAIQTGICKVFDFSAGSTGLSERAAIKEGFGVTSVLTSGPDKPGFMGGKLLINKMVAEKDTGRVLGFQCIGPGDVSKQVSQAAVAIMGGLTVEDLVNADLPYAPPFTLAVDNLIMTAQVLQNKMRGLFTGITAEELKCKIDRCEDPYILDLRGPDEYEMMRLGIGETLIPLGALRKRLHEIPQDKEKEIVCYCKISLRGYEGARILMQNGWKNVKVLEGGIVAWPYPREK